MTPGSGDVERLVEWADLIDDSNYYEILGVLPLADAGAIKTAFHEFALAFHPDGHEGAAEAERDAARSVFRRGAEAYRVLSDATLRSEYDLALARGHLRLVGSERPHAPGGPSTGLRSLEDLCTSPAAQLSARNADHEITRGNLVEARRLLKNAISLEEEDNRELQERLEALDLALFAMGD